jgi:hypothetical protein
MTIMARRVSPIQHVSIILSTLLCVWIVILLNTPFEIYPSLMSGDHARLGLSTLAFRGEGLRGLIRSGPMLLACRLVAVSACVVVLLIGDRRGIWLRLAAVTIVFLDFVAKSVGGFVNHSQALAVAVLILYAVAGKGVFVSVPALIKPLSGSGDPGSPDDLPSQRAATLIRLTALILLLPYTFIAANRLLTGGFAAFSGDAILYYIGSSSWSFAAFPSWLDPRAAPTLARLVFGITTALEMSALCAFLWSPYRRLWLVLIVVFHVASALLMNIFFWENMCLLVATLALDSNSLPVTPASQRG